MLSPRLRQFASYAAVLIGAIFLVWLLKIAYSSGSKPDRDFFDFYYAAVAARSGENIYTSGDSGYIYPPLLAILLVPLSRIAPVAASHLWSVILAILLPIAAILSAGEAARRVGIRLFRLDTFALAAVSVILIGMTWRSEFFWGNSNLLVIIPVIIALRVLDRMPVTAGLWLAFAVNIKYLPIVFLPYLLVRRRWRAAAAMTFGTVGFALLPALYLGWDRNIQYLRVAFLGFEKMTGAAIAEGSAANINALAANYSLSITSTAARFAERFSWPSGAMLLAVAVAAAAMLALGWGMYRAHGFALFSGRNADSDAAAPASRLLVGLEWSGLMTAALLFSPQTSLRHLNMLLPTCAFAPALLMRVGTKARCLLAAGLIVLALGATSIPGIPGWRNDIESWTELGGRAFCITCMYFALLYAGLQRAAELEPAAS